MKYMGSKSRIAKYIVPILQKYIDDNNIEFYWEPFVGGANIIDKISCKTKSGTDKNKYLIALLNHVANGGTLYESVPKELYDKARTAYNNGDTSEFEDWEIGNIGFLASYNGRFFDGGYAKPGYEKTKTGEKLRDYYQEAKRNLEKQAPNLKGCNFAYLDYKDYFPQGYLIYCDPPYKGTKHYSVSKGFDHEEFWDTVRKWSEYNYVVVSEQSAPDDFVCIWEKEVSRSVRATDKFNATEKLFVYKGK